MWGKELNMFPYLIVFYHRYGHRAYMKSFTNLFIWPWIKSYRFSLIYCKFMNVSIFSPTIYYIVSLISKEKMVWVYAKRIITFMKNFHSIRNRSFVKYPRYSMGLKSFFTWVIITYGSVFTFFSSMYSSNPMPTFIWRGIGYESLESFGKRIRMFPFISSHDFSIYHDTTYLSRGNL